MKTFQFMPIALAALFLIGCSAVRPFHEAPERNLHVRVKLKDDDAKIRADLDLFAKVDKCNDSYIGSVELNKPVMDIGLPIGKELHLTYSVTRNSFSGGRRTLNFLSSLTPRPGYEYYADLSWVDGMYNLEVFESQGRGKGKHRIALNPAQGC